MNIRASSSWLVLTGGLFFHKGDSCHVRFLKRGKVLKTSFEWHFLQGLYDSKSLGSIGSVNAGMLKLVGLVDGQFFLSRLLWRDL